MKLLRKFFLLFLLGISLFECKQKTPLKVPDYQLFLGNIHFLGNYSDSTNDKLPIGFLIQVFLVNNTNDTLRYMAYPGSDCRSFVVVGKNLQVNSYQRDEAMQFVLAPHKNSIVQVTLKFVKKLDTVFDLRIGMHLLKVSRGIRSKLSCDSLIARAPVLWSGVTRLKTGKKYTTLSRDSEIMKKEAKQIFAQPTAEDRKKYVLSVDQAYLAKINKRRDVAHPDNKAFIVPLLLSNRSSDTLKYINFSCDTADVFMTDNKQIRITGGEDCLGNYPMLYKLTPHKQTVFFLRILYPRSHQRPLAHFRIGMTMCGWGSQDVDNGSTANQYDYFGIISTDPVERSIYSLWSNDIEIPAPK